VTRTQYYEQMKMRARETRVQYDLDTPRVLRSDLRRIFKDQGVRVDLWPYKFKAVRGAYLNDDVGATVMLAKGLPEDPMVFTMAHELKHHLEDRQRSLALCGDQNVQHHIEIGAEVFAAELIFPEADFSQALAEMAVGAGKCSPEALVRLKCQTRTTLSYAALVKRAEFLGFAKPGALAGVKWKKLEEQIFGVPIYKKLRRQGRQV
jgi:Zn-dependent peptidase ImmA (M78 family)